jgi:hypothetical protein
MMFSYRKISCTALLAISTIFAGPKIEIDPQTYDCGIILDGKADKLNAVFTVKNTGDAPLKLTNVKPGCGCTVVKYDTLIAPGKTTKIESTVNIRGYRSGPVNKSITVFSNANADSILRVSIAANIIPAVDYAPKSIEFANSINFQVTLISPKKDLTVTDVSFKTDTGNYPVKFTISSLDTIRSDKLNSYKLNLTPNSTKGPQSGNIIIKTNHPDLKELSITATTK